MVIFEIILSVVVGQAGECLGEWEWYRSREENIYIKGAILGLVRDLALEGIPGVHKDVPS